MASESFTDQLLRKRALLQEQFAATRAEFDRQLEAIDVLLAAERNQASQQMAVHGDAVQASRLERRLRERRNREMHEANSALASTDALLANRHESTRDQVRAVLRAIDGPMRMADVVMLVGRISPTTSEDTVRSVLQRMVHSGEAEKVERGMYRLAPRRRTATDPAADSSIDFSSAIVEVEPG